MRSKFEGRKEEAKEIWETRLGDNCLCALISLKFYTGDYESRDISLKASSQKDREGFRLYFHLLDDRELVLDPLPPFELTSDPSTSPCLEPNHQTITLSSFSLNSHPPPTSSTMAPRLPRVYLIRKLVSLPAQLLPEATSFRVLTSSPFSLLPS